LFSQYSKAQIARTLDFSRSSFYHQSTLDKKDELIKNTILEIYENDDTLGPKKLASLLGIGHNRIARIMNKYSLHPRKATNGYSYPGKADNIYPNLLLGNEVVDYSDLLVSDMFEFRLADGTKVYGCFILKHSTRQTISMVFDYTKDTSLIIKAINQAEDYIDPRSIFHFDQAKQHGAKETTQALENLRLLISMSRAGTPTDNPFAERFVGIFKLAVVKRQQYFTFGHFLDKALVWVNFYNQTRPHEALKQISPNDYAKQNGRKVVYLSSVFGV